jgi:hypothetical protein
MRKRINIKIRKPKNKIEKIEWSCLSVIGFVFGCYLVTLIFLSFFN